MSAKPHILRVWDNGVIREGNARNILEQIRAEGEKNNKVFKKMDVAGYADALIEDAPYFLNKSLMQALMDERYPTKYDRALKYLATRPESRLHIISANLPEK